MKNKIKIISMGPGHPDLLTFQAEKALNEIELAIGVEKFKSFNLNVPLIVPGELIADTIKEIKKYHGKNIGVLVTGDAGFYSLAKSVIKEFGKENVEVVPGISIVQLAFSKLCEPWHKANFYSVHGRNRSAIEKAKGDERFLILCDNKNTASSVMSELIDMIDTHNIYVLENLSMKNEKIIEIRLQEDIKKINDESLSLIIGIGKENV